MDSAATPVVTHRKGYTHTITDIASPTRLEVFAALAETRKSLAYAVLVTHGPVWDNFARDLVVWAAPRIPAANKGEALLPRTVNGTGHTDPSEFCATSI